jgi:hypothetical protein
VSIAFVGSSVPSAPNVSVPSAPICSCAEGQVLDEYMSGGDMHSESRCHVPTSEPPHGVYAGQVPLPGSDMSTTPPVLLPPLPTLNVPPLPLPA